jgi:hypothetical protein
MRWDSEVTELEAHYGCTTCSYCSMVRTVVREVTGMYVGVPFTVMSCPGGTVDGLTIRESVIARMAMTLVSSVSVELFITLIILKLCCHKHNLLSLES